MEQSLQATEYPVWFNGKTVNEAPQMGFTETKDDDLPFD